MGILDQLLAELNARQQPVNGFKHTTPTGTPSNPYYTGPNSLFGMTGVDRGLISTLGHPIGLASMLPVRGSVIAQPVFGYLTAFDGTGAGSNPNGVCDDGPTPGTPSTCFQMAQFGRYTEMTREVELNRIGLQINGYDVDFTVVNPPLYQAIAEMLAPMVPGGSSPSFTNEVGMRFLELSIDFHRRMARQVYQGNPANNSAGGGYKEFPGLDLLIGTGKRDAFTNTLCPTLDSMIYNYNYANISVGGGDAIVKQLAAMIRSLKYTASRQNLDPVRWVMVMRQALFYELSAIWPCSYMTSGCSFRTSDGTIVQNIDAGTQIRMRDDFRNRQVLLFDGQEIDVVIDDSLDEESSGDTNLIANGSFASDIYIVPLSVRGGSIPSLYWEYLNYNEAALGALPGGIVPPNTFWTDRGMFLWHSKPPKNWCLQWIVKTEPRLILRTPHLAARLNNVRYQTLIHEREFFPDDPYYVGGGVSTARPAPSLYKSWT